MTKVVLDQNKCIGCNTCPLLDPEVFEMDTATYKAKIKNQPEKISEATQSAINSCPVGAISTSEE